MKKLFYFFLSLALVSCDFSYPIKINEQDSFVVKSDCGNLFIHTSVWGGNEFHVYLKGENIENPFTINIDSVEMFLPQVAAFQVIEKHFVDSRKGRSLPKQTYLLDQNQEETMLSVKVNRDIREGLAFSLYAKGLLNCEGKSLIQDTIIFQYVRR
ncbi:MAG: hypothetical protein R3D00_08455 [Bacteroidia bacterium]